MDGCRPPRKLIRSRTEDFTMQTYKDVNSGEILSNACVAIRWTKVDEATACSRK